MYYIVTFYCYTEVFKNNNITNCFAVFLIHFTSILLRISEDIRRDNLEIIVINMPERPKEIYGDT